MRLTLMALLLALSFCHSHAAAQAGEQEQAAEHFERGVELYRDGSLDAALVEFERAYELMPNYQLLFNLAQVQAERQDYVRAIELFQRYLSEGGASLSEERTTEVRAELARLRKRVASLWVETNVEDAKLFVNGVLVGTLPLQDQITINAGVCAVRIEKQGYQTQTHEFKVAGGETPRLNLPLSQVAEPATRPSNPTVSVVPPPPRNLTPFWISAGVTVALGGGTVAFALLARSADQDLEAIHDEFPVDFAREKEVRSDLKLYSALTDGFAAGTIVAAGFSVYFLARPPSSRSTTDTGLRSLRVIPRGSGGVLTGRF